MRLRTDFARCVGHGSYDLRGRSYHLGKLADGYTSQDADEKLVPQCFLHPRFTQNGMGDLWFATKEENQSVCNLKRIRKRLTRGE